MGLKIMPYPRAWLWVTVLVMLTVPAFWPNYLGKLGVVEWQLHVHGVTAGLWALLVIIQSFTIHRGQGNLHRTAGLASLVLAPLFLAGGLLVIATMAIRPGPFTELFGARLAAIDAVSVFGFAAFVFLALKHRRNTGLHASWMLATIIPLINPTVGRLIPAFVPGLTIRSVEELPRFASAVHLAQTLAIGIAFFLFLRYRRHGTPMLIVAAMLVFQTILFETVGRSEWWSDVHAHIGATSPMLLLVLGITLGVVAVAAGWISGGTSRREAQARA